MNRTMLARMKGFNMGFKATGASLKLSVLVKILVAVMVFWSPAQARVFDFKNEWFAIYFGGSFGNSNAGDGAYGLSGGYITKYDKKVSTGTSAELGLVLSGTRYNLKIGGEYLVPRDQMGVTGSTAVGTQLFSLDSKLSALMPTVDVELMFARESTSHGFFGVGYGLAVVSLSNEYTMTDTGQLMLSTGSYKEMASGSAPMIRGYLGWEFLMTDTVTCVSQIGYRYLKVPELKATQNATAISGAQTTGQPILNMDGGSRSLDLGGAYVGVDFRFYM